MKILLAGLALLGAACATARTHVAHVRGPDGDNWVAISCSQGQSFCLEAAGLECPGGYISGENVNGVGVFGPDGNNPSPPPVYVVDPRIWNMFIKCKAPGPPPPGTALPPAASK